MADNMMSERSRGTSINSLKELLARSQQQEELNTMDEESFTELTGCLQQEQQLANTSQNIPNTATEQG